VKVVYKLAAEKAPANACKKFEDAINTGIENAAFGAVNGTEYSISDNWITVSNSLAFPSDRFLRSRDLGVKLCNCIPPLTITCEWACGSCAMDPCPQTDTFCTEGGSGGTSRLLVEAPADQEPRKLEEGICGQVRTNIEGFLDTAPTLLESENSKGEENKVEKCIEALKESTLEVKCTVE